MTDIQVEMSAIEQLLHYHGYHLSIGYCAYRSPQEDLGHGASKDPGRARKFAKTDA